MPKERRTRRELAPYDVDERPVIAVGMVLWVVAFVVMLVFFRGDLRRHDTEWWLWSCWVGIALGLYGLRFVTRRRRAIERDRLRTPEPGAEEPGGQEWPNGSEVSPSLTEPGS